MNQQQIRQLDLSSLLVFLHLVRHRKATRAALEMGLTQSAVSHALKRLRAVFADPLFLRQPHGLEPTAKAIHLEPIVQQAIDLLSHAFETLDEFNPRKAQATIKIAAHDYDLCSVLPKLLPVLRDQAQGITVQASSIDGASVAARLDDRQIDLALGYSSTLGKRLVAEAIYSEQYCVVARTGHPLTSGSMSFIDYADAAHLLIATDGRLRGLVDKALEKHGLARNAATIVPTFFLGLAILRQSDLIATIPSRVASAYQTAFDLVSIPLPLDVPAFPVLAIRHQREQNNPMHRWLIGLMSDLLQSGGDHHSSFDPEQGNLRP